MKEKELRQHATCSACGEKVGKASILFWRVTAERFGINRTALQQQDGLAMLLGSSELANVVGADKDLAEPVMKPVVLTICEKCAFEELCIAELVEKATKIT